MIQQASIKIIRFENFQIKTAIQHGSLLIQAIQTQIENQFQPFNPFNSFPNNNFMTQSNPSVFRNLQPLRPKNKIIYSAKFATVPSVCQVWFDNIYEVYNTIQNQAVSVAKAGQSILIMFSFIIKLNQINIIKQFTLPLQKSTFQNYVQNSQHINKLQTNQQYQMQEEQPVQKVNRNGSRLYQSHDQRSMRQAMNPKQQPFIFEKPARNQNYGRNMEPWQQFLFNPEQQLQFFPVFTLPFQPFQPSQITLPFQPSQIVLPPQPSQIILQNKCTDGQIQLVKLNYKFSRNKKEQSIKLISQKLAISKTIYKSKNCILLQPNFQLYNKHLHQHYQIYFKITTNRYFTAVGICQKQTVKNVNYKFQIGNRNYHGCYILQNCGTIFSNYLNQHASKKYENLVFQKDDIIKIRYCPKNKTVKFIKNNDEIRSIEVSIKPNTTPEQLCFCAFLSGMDDEIQIIEPQVYRNKSISQVNSQQKEMNRQQFLSEWMLKNRKM